MSIEPEFLTHTIELLAVLTLVFGVFTVVAHAWGRGRSRRDEARARDLSREFSCFLTGELDDRGLLARARRASARVLWSAVERFADNIGGAEWIRLTEVLGRLPVAIAERRRLRDLRPWRRALAARHLGMLRDATMRGPLRAAMARGPMTVTLSAALALARLRDRKALRWLLAHPEATQALGPRVLTALLKRFGRSAAGDARLALVGGASETAIGLAVIEMLGIWRDRRALTELERLLSDGAAETRVAAARSLGHLRARTSVPALLVALGDSAWQVRAQAARALGEIPSRAALDLLRSAMEDSAWWVRRNAGYALAAHGEPGTTALHRLAQLGADPYARSMAIEVLQASAWEEWSPGGMSRVA